MPFLMKANGQASNSLAENLNTLRETHFNNSTTQYTTNNGTDAHLNQGLDHDLSSFMTLELLNKAIDSLPNGKAPGPDGIKNEILSRLPHTYRAELLSQFKSSIAMAFIPPAWLNIKVIYISKGGNRPPSEPKHIGP